MEIYERENGIGIRCKGRITNLWKVAERTDSLIQGINKENQRILENTPMVFGGNGTYVSVGEYLGTSLYINVTIYDPLVFEFGNSKYKIPKQLRMECYENTRNAINEKVFGNLAITKDKMHYLRELMVGKKNDVLFHIPNQEEKDGHICIVAYLPYKLGNKEPFIYKFYLKKLNDKLQ